jgi:cellulose synthase/poly-beta-1,6-N-acetylglucosamine synthase-like glycosyltransferase
MGATLEVFVHRVYFFLEAFIIGYVFTINAIYFLLLVLSFAVIRRRGQAFTSLECASLLRSAALPRVSVIMPAHNEALSIAESVRSMLKLRYPNFEIIVVNDGSQDRTLDVLVENYCLYRSARTRTGSLETKPVRGVYESATPLNLLVVDKMNGGKADAINTGINYAGSPLILVVDADSLLDPDALLQVVKPYLEDPRRVVAVGGMVRAVNDCPVRHGRVRAITTSQFYIANCQSVEYVRAFLGGRIGFGFLNALLIVSGAFGLFRRDVVLEVGGFRHDTVGEDMELVVRIHKLMRQWKRDYHVAFVPTPVCWTEVPVSLRVLRRQRRRWQRGTVESILLHREMILNPRYGLVGMLAAPYFLLFEMLGPLVEFAGYVLTVAGLVFQIIAPLVAILFFTVSTAFGVFLSTTSLALDQYTRSHHGQPKDLVKLFLVAVFENLGFRQWITFCRVHGLIEGLKGKKGGWGEMERRGFSTTAAAGR